MSIERISEIVFKAQSYDLLALDEAREELKIDAGDTSNDAWLGRVITQVSDMIQAYVKRRFAVETILDTFYLRQEPQRYAYRMPSGVDALQLSRWPLGSFFVVAETTAAAVTSYLVEGTDYVANKDQGALTRLDPVLGVAVSWQAQTIAVTYEGGYESMPPLVTASALRLVVARWHARARDPQLLERVSPMLGTERWWVGGPKGGSMTGLPSEVEGMLNIYRAPTAA